MKYLSWLLSLFFWDGALPILVVLLPALLHLFLPRRHLLEQFMIFFLPFTLFFVRAWFGLRRMTELSPGKKRQPWRIGFFLPALFILAVMEAGLIAMGMIGVPIGPKDRQIMACIYLFYLALIAMAFFPASYIRHPVLQQNENPWKSLGLGA